MFSIIAFAPLRLRLHSATQSIFNRLSGSDKFDQRSSSPIGLRWKNKLSKLHSGLVTESTFFQEEFSYHRDSFWLEVTVPKSDHFWRGLFVCSSEDHDYIQEINFDEFELHLRIAFFIVLTLSLFGKCNWSRFLLRRTHRPRFFGSFL